MCQSVLPLTDGQPRTEITRRAIRSYVKILEEYVLRYPDQWNGWKRQVRREESDLRRQLS